MSTGTPREIRWTWQSNDNDLRRGYMSVDGRVSIADLIAHMAEVAPGVDLADIEANWATVVWTRQATADELAARAEATRRNEERREAWERETLARLIKKYGRWGGRPAHRAALAEETP
jgi:hypothetical protein